MSGIENFILGLPKADLYLRVEGALEPEAMLASSVRNNVPLRWQNLEEARQAALAAADRAAFERLVDDASSVLRLRQSVERAGSDLGMTCDLILLLSRRHGEDAAQKTLNTAFDDEGWIAGVGLDALEEGQPPSKLKSVFDKARSGEARLGRASGAT